MTGRSVGGPFDDSHPVELLFRKIEYLLLLCISLINSAN